LAASTQCAAVTAAAREATKAMSKALQHELSVREDLQCLMLQVQLKQKTGSDVAAYAATLSDKDQDHFSGQLMKIFALTGTNFQQAVFYGEKWKANYEKAFKSSKVLLERIQKATKERLEAYEAGKTHP
jgi:hypothetical protein